MGHRRHQVVRAGGPRLCSQRRRGVLALQGQHGLDSKNDRAATRGPTAKQQCSPPSPSSRHRRPRPRHVHLRRPPLPRSTVALSSRPGAAGTTPSSSRSTKIPVRERSKKNLFNVPCEPKDAPRHRHSCSRQADTVDGEGRWHVDHWGMRLLGDEKSAIWPKFMKSPPSGQSS